MITDPRKPFLAGVLKTKDGRQLHIDARTGQLELSTENASLISINEEGILGVGTALLDLPFALNDDMLSISSLEEGPDGHFILTCQVDEAAGVHFYKDDIAYTFTEDQQLRFLPLDGQVTPIQLLLEEKEIPYFLISGHEHCCGVKRPKPDITPQWDDLGHHVMVDLAKAYVMEHHTGPKSSIWKKNEFIDALFRGLKDADYENPYNDGGKYQGAWRSHFFDPVTRQNYRWQTDRTALTEGLKYYQISITSSEPTTAGYNLGLALHYFTDLTQPCHAANFAEIFAQDYPNPGSLTKVHSFLEEVGDELMAKHPPAIKGILVYNQEITIEDLYVETATISKAIFERLLAKVPDLPKRYNYLDDANTIKTPEKKIVPAQESLRPLLLPFVKEALQKGLEQTARFLDRWNKDYVHSQPDTYYLKLWLSDPSTHAHTWLGYLALNKSNLYASFIQEDPSQNSKILVVSFVDEQGKVVNPRNYGKPVYMVALNHPDGQRILQGESRDGVYAAFHAMNTTEDGYPLEVYASNVIAGQFGIRRTFDKKEWHKSGKYYIEYNEGTNNSSIAIEFIPASNQ